RAALRCTCSRQLLALNGRLTMSAPTSARGGKAEMLRTTNSTLLTPRRRRPNQNPAVQQAPDSILDNPLCCHGLLAKGQRMQFGHLKRREFVTVLGGAVVWPIAARAQQGQPMRRIGVLMNLAADDPVSIARAKAFVEGLQALGWTNGRN